MAMNLGGYPRSVCPSFATRCMSITNLLIKLFLYLKLLFLTHVNFFFQNLCLLR